MIIRFNNTPVLMVLVLDKSVLVPGNYCDCGSGDYGLNPVKVTVVT